MCNVDCSDGKAERERENRERLDARNEGERVL